MLRRQHEHEPAGDIDGRTLAQRLEASFEDRERALYLRIDELSRMRVASLNSAWWQRVWIAFTEALRKQRLRRVQEQLAQRREEFYAITELAIEAAKRHDCDQRARAHAESAHELLRRAAVVSRKVESRPDVVKMMAPQPSAAPHEDPDHAADREYLGKMETFAEREFDALVNQAMASEAAHELLDRIGVPPLRPCGTMPEPFRINTCHGLAQLLAHAPPQEEVARASLLLRRCTLPSQMRSPESWFLLWTGVGVLSGYAEQTDGNSANEAVKAERWCAAWHAQMASWSPQVAASVGLRKDELGTVTLPVAGGAGETATGADLILLLWVQRLGVNYCRAVSVQFKRADGDDRVLNVERNGWRQFDRLDEIESRSEGRWSAIYALLRDQPDALATVAAVPMKVARVALKRDQPKVSANAGQSKPRDFQLRWDECGRPMAVAMANVLCQPKAATYADVGVALAAMNELAQRDLRPYLIVQGIGVSARTIRQELARHRELLQRMGLDVDRERTLGRSRPAPDRGGRDSPGHSM